MNIFEMKKIYNENKDLFIENFGFFLMKVSRKDLPQLISLGLETQNKIIYKKIFNNIPFLVKKVKIGELGTLLNVLFDYPTLYSEVVKDFAQLSKYFAPNNIDGVIDAFLKVNPNSKIIAENLETFLENAKTKVRAMQIMNAVSHIPKCEYKIKQYYTVLNNLDEDFHFLENLNVGTMMKIVNAGKLDTIKDFFLQYSNGNLKNVHFLTSGFTSSVFSVDDKVIKIGKERIKFNAQFSKYLLQPYFRKQFYDLDDNVIFTVEVQDKCSTNVNPDEAQEFLLTLYNDIDKYIWVDSGMTSASIQNPELLKEIKPNLENFFTLIKPNTRKIPAEEDGFCYDGVVDKEPYGQPGDFTIADTDFIYSPEEFKERENGYKTPDHETKFSIILPTYNMENYLEKCLNSILNQTSNNYEVIIIDDGSPDNSAEIAREYAAMDSRFKVYSFENGGLSTARNRGIDLAQGKYILLVDPDDCIEPELLEKLEPYIENSIDIIRFGAIVEGDSPKKNPLRFNRPYYPEVLSGIEALQKWNDDTRYSTVWLYCIKKEVYDRCNFRFPMIKIYEDVASMPKLIAHADSVAMLDYIGYRYIQHENTITNGQSEEKKLYNLSGFITAYDFIKDEITSFFKKHPEQKDSESILLDGFFARLENKFKHTNSIRKNSYALNLFSRHKPFLIDYNSSEYFELAKKNNIIQIRNYIPETNSPTVKYKDTTITKQGTYTYNINGFIDNIELYQVSKEGQYNFTDSFLCMSHIDFERLESDSDYKEIVFKYLLSYSNLFLAESLNGSYIGEILTDNNGTLGVNFNPKTTTFAKDLRNKILQIPIKSSAEIDR